jgi:hypothetical protein
MLRNIGSSGQPKPIAHGRRERRPHGDIQILIACGRVAFIIERLPNDAGTMVDIFLVLP